MARYRRVARVINSAGLARPIHAVAGAMYAVDTEEQVFHLTFDDGPHPDVTPPVLDVLEEFGAIATFFVLTSAAESYPDLIRRTLSLGHGIGLHSRTHARLPNVSWRQLCDEICAARRDLEELTQLPVRWYRPPFGAESMRSIAVVKACRMRTVGWSADLHDWKGLTEDDPLRNASKHLTPGGIALLHDVPVGSSVAEDDAAGFTRKEAVTRSLLSRMEREGLRPVSLPDLLQLGHPLRRAKLA